MRSLLPFLLAAAPAVAEPPKIESSTATQTGGNWTISVTLSHPDTGWDHYADGWRVETADGEVLDTRILHHPHVDEQPFTRSLTGLTLPAGLDTIHIRSKCSTDGWSQDATPLPLN